jgi:uncharacterized tellurite resistance protein B-like protein
MSNEVKLTNVATVTLRKLLEQPSWAKTTELLYLAGKLLCSVIPEVEVPKEEVEQTKWKEVQQSFTLTSRERDTCLAAIRSAVKEGALLPGKYSFELLDVFGEVPTL